jgi:hypothetical protein
MSADTKTFIPVLPTMLDADYCGSSYVKSDVAIAAARAICNQICHVNTS